MAKTSKKAKAKVVGAFGEDTKTNQPVVPLPLSSEVRAWEDTMKQSNEPLVETSSTTPARAKPKEQPKTWPFSKSNTVNEKKEMEHVSRLVNMKHDNPGVVQITKVVVYDCRSRRVKCRDYKIDYKKE